MSMVVVNFCQNFRKNKFTAKHENVLNHFQEETVSDAVLVLFLLIFNEILSVRGERANTTSNYMLKVNNRNSRTRCEICSKLTIKTPERRLA